MNPKKKPNYDPKQILQDLMDAVVSIYTDGSSGGGASLAAVADELDLNPIKVRKLLITAGVYESTIADDVLVLRRRGCSVPEIMRQMNLSRSSVNSYLPYTRPPYNAVEVSANADRVRKFRERNTAVEKLAAQPSFERLWSAILLFQAYPFYTAKGLKFKYTVNGGEIKVDRKEKTITIASVKMAYEKAKAGDITGPKKLGVFGAPYLYPIFLRLGVV